MLKWQSTGHYSAMITPEVAQLLRIGSRPLLVDEPRDPMTIEAQLHEKRMSSHWLRQLDGTETTNTGEENES